MGLLLAICQSSANPGDGNIHPGKAQPFRVRVIKNPHGDSNVVKSGLIWTCMYKNKQQ